MHPIARPDQRGKRLALVIVGPVLLAVIAALWLTPANGQGARTEAQLVAALQEAVAREDVTMLRSLSQSPADGAFQWVTDETGGPAWRVSGLRTPMGSTDEAAYVAFSRYQRCESSNDHLYRLHHTSTGACLGPEVMETDILGWRVRAHDLRVRLDVAAAKATIEDKISLEPTQSAERVALLRLNAIYAVRTVTGPDGPLPWSQSGGFVAIVMPTACASTIDLAYDGMPSSDEDFVKSSEAALTAYWYPHTGRMPSTASVALTVPDAWTGIASGELVSRSTSGGVSTTRWRNDLPVCYHTIAAGRYTVTTQESDGIAVSAYLLNANEARARSVISAASGALTWFGKTFAKYPYSRYAVVESNTFPPALECYSFTLCGRHTLPGVVPHEVSHTWWGGIVPNTYTRTMWNEALATYTDELYQRRRRRTSGRGSAVGSGSAAGGHPSAVSLMQARDAMNPIHSAVGYGKGAAVMRNLESMIGSETMIKGLQRFIARHRPGEAAEWSDIVDAFAEVAGSEWRGYFDAWLSRTDLPTLSLRDVAVEPVDGRFAVKGVVTQGESTFWMRTPIAVDTGVSVVRLTVDVKGSDTPFRLICGTRPLSMAIDPDGECMRTKGAVADGTLVLAP